MFYRVFFILSIFLATFLNANILKDIKSFEAKFEQKIINPSQKVIVYEGEILIKEPYYILWKYATPVIKNVYIINNFAIIDEPELEQAILSRLQNEIDILELIKSAKEISKNKYKANIYDTDYLLFVENEKISKIEFKDNLENQVIITFKDVNQNIEIDEEVFKFLPPEHYDVIRK